MADQTATTRETPASAEKSPVARGRDDQPMFWAPSLDFLRYAGWSIVVAAAGTLLTILLTIPEQPWRAAGPGVLMLVAVSALRLMSTGRVRASLAVLVWGTWLTVVGISTFFGGLRGLLVIVYPLLILTGGWLLGTATAVLLGLLTVAAIFGFLIADWWGLLPHPPTPILMYAVVQVAGIVVALLLITHLIRSYRSRIDEVDRLSVDLAQRTADLQAREADLNRAQAVAHVGSGVLDLATGKIQLSAESCRIFGLPEGTTGSMDAFVALVHPEDRGALQQASEAALQGEPFDKELRIVIGNTIRWIAQRAEVEFDQGGRAVRSVGTTQDITERKELEATLREQREFFRLISESIGEHIAVLDLEGRRVYNSPSYRQFFGDTRDLRGTIRLAMCTPMTANGCSGYSGDGRNRRWPGIEYRLLRQDGSVRYMSSAGKVIKDKAGSGGPHRRRVARHHRPQAGGTVGAHCRDYFRVAAGHVHYRRQGGHSARQPGVHRDHRLQRRRMRRTHAETAQFGSPRRHAFYQAMRESLERTGPGRARSGTAARTARSSRSG
jgi:PAS domain S-box-containing protein